MTRFSHHFDADFSHQYYRGGWDIWHIVGIILGIILLLAIVGFVINCIRNQQVNSYYGQPGVVGGVGAQPYY